MFPEYSARSMVCENIVDEGRIKRNSLMIPEDEIYHYYQGRHNKLLKRLKKEFPEEFPETGQNYSAEL